MGKYSFLYNTSKWRCIYMIFGNGLFLMFIKENINITNFGLFRSISSIVDFTEVFSSMGTFWVFLLLVLSLPSYFKLQLMGESIFLSFSLFLAAFSTQAFFHFRVQSIVLFLESILPLSFSYFLESISSQVLFFIFKFKELYLWERVFFSLFLFVSFPFKKSLRWWIFPITFQFVHSSFSSCCPFSSFTFWLP